MPTARKTKGVALLLGFSMLRMATRLGVGACQPQQRTACQDAFLDCKLSIPVSDKNGICACAAVYYAACLSTAGCAAAEEMVACVDDLMQLDCPDMSVCGNDCTVEDGDPIIPEGSIVLPVNNFGANYLQLSVCSKGVNAAKLSRFGQVSMERCDDDDYRVCDLAIAPRALTAVAFPPDVTYLRVETCVLTTATTTFTTDEDEEDGDEQDYEEIWECLQDPLPVEIYGATVVYGSGDGATSLSHWPSSLDVEYSVAALCEQDSHCPGSFCSSQQQPRVCAPKLGEHFRESGKHFLDPRWEILGRAT